MGSLGALMKHPDDFYPLLKLKMAARQAEKQIPSDPHWGFCFSMFHKVSRSFALVIQQLHPQPSLGMQSAYFIWFFELLILLRMTLALQLMLKVQFLWIFNVTYIIPIGTFLEAIEDITLRMGAGMAKFICKEVETVDDYYEYCHYVAGLVGLGLSKLFHAYGSEDLAPESLSNSMGLFLQKTNIIRDYLEDINEIPKSRMFWPRKIWSKYVIKLEIMAIGTLALCYNNIKVFRGVVKMRCGLTAKVIDRTKTMADVYGSFYDFSCMLKVKVDKNDPNAQKTLSRLDSILKTC
ncbi:Squalene synthase [Hibiscus syriacus]|uniref:Squalene synthase n=1 Tax=Hibiscus syriacus TaxID=106335 RepID=A0A6A2XWB2_HIBSY|nr:Squalene synthase [Hibiscus syriacus]